VRSKLIGTYRRALVFFSAPGTLFMMSSMLTRQVPLPVEAQEERIWLIDKFAAT
jgi:hypothetical protein